MPTQKQIEAQLKRDRAEVKRGIVARVTSAALRIIYISHLKDSRLWPKDGVLSHSTATFSMDDLIDVQVLITYNQDGISNETLKINLINSNYSRLSKQKDQIELILNQAIEDNIHFEYIDFSEIGIGLGNTWSTLTFKFTIIKQL
jgi:hypothetical protein